MEAFLFGDTVPEILKHRAIRAWARARVRSRFAGREKKLTSSDLATGEEEFARSEIETHWGLWEMIMRIKQVQTAR